MRKEIEKFLKDYIRIYLLKTREKRELSQDKISELLEMSRRGYVKLEYGTSCCNTVTFILIILVIEDNPAEFINDLRNDFFRSFKAESREFAFI